MGEAVSGIDQIWCGCPDLGPDILGGGSVGPVARVRDVGDDSSHQEGVGRIPPQGGPQDGREADSDREGLSVDILPAGGRSGGSETVGGGELHLLPQEHGHTVHYNQDHYGPVSGGVAETGPRISKRWWEQDVVDVEDMRTAAREAERTEGEEETDGT